MDLQKFDFKMESNFSMKPDPQLLAEAKKQGFYNGHTPYNKLFSKMLFVGGGFTYKASVTEEFKRKVVPYFKVLAGSFEPKHEEKEAICALLLSELAEIE